ncbi:hypothetical protein EMIHUDRAFT_453072 [Emiliania huxleyi CCMP1516]|uniref:Uncharacterized protein n=2 Tax=Emiliania huxleyi TaxID=2903 RepID=A0A0D3IAN4_EMIH1|nr:hypothetical protein EMIHUDRAFT_453072 [Emiliania huxleyi CCMP1516]EOD08319.1 hypothetical protein EMIHUDRAFT_453072 [Emiliania huxleyi CCMP1516]|eukprot:XP_005760748.1 hypothetical protein EMIHUDRAFT_453072 [Emiliania huxleyi CCMP1516]
MIAEPVTPGNKGIGFGILTFVKSTAGHEEWKASSFTVKLGRAPQAFAASFEFVGHTKFRGAPKIDCLVKQGREEQRPTLLAKWTEDLARLRRARHTASPLLVLAAGVVLGVGLWAARRRFVAPQRRGYTAGAGFSTSSASNEASTLMKETARA